MAQTTEIESLTMRSMTDFGPPTSTVTVFGSTEQVSLFDVVATWIANSLNSRVAYGSMD
jgi:hypothetical protein